MRRRLLAGMSYNLNPSDSAEISFIAKEGFEAIIISVTPVIKITRKTICSAGYLYLKIT